MTFRKPLFSLVCLFFVGISLSGCSGSSVVKNDPRILYEEAEQDIENDRYLMAHDKLALVKNRFPYSKYAVLAKIRIADLHFMEESYAEAAASYETFCELHPQHETVPHAKYRIGESYYKDTPDVTARDLTSSKKALEAFYLFAQQFPNHPKVSEANERIKEIKNKLAEKELYIANWYLGQDQYQSAEGRYAELLKNYPDSTSAKEASKGLRTAREELKKQNEQ